MKCLWEHWKHQFRKKSYNYFCERTAFTLYKRAGFSFVLFCNVGSGSYLFYIENVDGWEIGTMLFCFPVQTAERGKIICISKMVDYLKKALIYGHTRRISS
ncbi:MAG: hypothetical protein HDQ97_16035 [Lachnospiraceae bacterium]|nr:hypothetical protein [Lachnospiraceae bacterium]